MIEIASCPLCDAPATGTRCSCGYDFTTGDPGLAIEARKTRFLSARRRLRRGFVILATLPITVAIAQAAPSVLLLLRAVWLTQLFASAYFIVGGLRTYVVARRELAAATQLQQLPSARVVR
ncbi:MAG: hypothetical protein JWP01_225 [Myxococcales bacterium]|nr:hypothetical protein [Myxococcales bacterium]